MVSFNVESLFTNVPIEGTVQAMPQKPQGAQNHNSILEAKL